MLDLHTVCVPTTYTCTVTSWTSSEFIFTLGTVQCFLGELGDVGRFTCGTCTTCWSMYIISIVKVASRLIYSIS